MLLNQNTNNNYTARQLKLPLEIEKLIDISDPVYTFCEVMDHIDLSGYFVEKGYKTGRSRCDTQKLLKVILFAFMENGICSLREKLGDIFIDAYKKWADTNREKEKGKLTASMEKYSKCFDEHDQFKGYWRSLCKSAGLLQAHY